MRKNQILLLYRVKFSVAYTQFNMYVSLRFSYLRDLLFGTMSDDFIISPSKFGVAILMIMIHSVITLVVVLLFDYEKFFYFS